MQKSMAVFLVEASPKLKPSSIGDGEGERGGRRRMERVFIKIEREILGGRK